MQLNMSIEKARSLTDDQLSQLEILFYSARFNCNIKKDKTGRLMNDQSSQLEILFNSRRIQFQYQGKKSEKLDE